jgi:hypothetical protein
MKNPLDIYQYKIYRYDQCTIVLRIRCLYNLFVKKVPNPMGKAVRNQPGPTKCGRALFYWVFPPKVNRLLPGRFKMNKFRNNSVTPDDHFTICEYEVIPPKATTPKKNPLNRFSLRG